MADFDPDAYLKQRQGAAFDPESYLREKSAARTPAIQPAPPANQPGAGSAFVRGAVEGGTLGFGDELSGALTAGQQFLAEHPMFQRFATAQFFTPDKDLLLQPITDKFGSAPASLSDVYAQTRNEERRSNDAAAKAHPLAFLGGSLAGALATAKPVGALMGAAGLANGTRAARILKQGAALGGLAGLGASSATSPGGMAEDALGVSGAENAARDIGSGHPLLGALDLAGSGALGGLGVGAAMEGAAPVLRGLGSRLESFGLGMGRRTLANLSESLSNKKPLPDASVREALEAGAIKPLRGAKSIAKNLVDATETAAEREQAVIDRLAELGVRAPADPIIEQLANAISRAGPNTLEEGVPRAYQKAALQIIDRTAPDSTLGVDQLENLKRSAQQKARQAYEALRSTEKGNAQKEIAAILRQANEDAIQRAAEAAPATSDIRTNAEAFLPLKEKLARLIPARDLALKGAMRGANRSMLGLTGQELVGEGLASGDPSTAARNWMAALAQTILKERGPATAASLAYSGGKGLRQAAPLLANPAVSMVAAALQRGAQTGAPPRDFWVDKNGVPHVVVHTMPETRKADPKIKALADVLAPAP